jgi:hypothetical protein
MKTLTTSAWFGFLLAVIAQLILRLVHVETPIALIVLEMICAAVVVVTESLNWWRRSKG